jgi:hypothetical protein
MIKVRLISAILALVALVFQHIIHEFSHVIAAKCMGIPVLKIQWLTYHGGTRIFYADEPDLNNDKNIPKKWALISGAGFVVTNIFGYFGAIVLWNINNNAIYRLMNLVLTFFVLVFLMVDCIYFLLGSIFNFGDIIGVRAVLKISRRTAIIANIIFITLHFIIIKFLIY